MEERKTVREVLDFPIKRGQEWKEEITFGDICSVKDVLPTDELYHITHKEQEPHAFSMSDNEHSWYIPTIQVIRERLETDDEFLVRKQEDERRIGVTEEKEKLEYLRLKAKFEK
tara:strand:+ start:1230 stop:1571 length:342 start_codon:yes stop_codon:yes gene_type:complete